MQAILLVVVCLAGVGDYAVVSGDQMPTPLSVVVLPIVISHGALLLEIRFFLSSGKQSAHSGVLAFRLISKDCFRRKTFFQQCNAMHKQSCSYRLSRLLTRAVGTTVNLSFHGLLE